MEMKEEHSTLSNASLDDSAVLTLADVENAICKLDEASKEPYPVFIRSKTEWWKMTKKAPVIRDFMSFYGLVVIKDELLPENIARFQFSDGTYKDIDISVRPSFTSLHSNK